MGNPLLQIRKLGQSIWYDNLSRELLRSGELKRMIEEDGVTGVTSNPTIFEKAIGKERIYDIDLHNLVDEGCSVEAIYEALAIEDIREAADLLRPVYKQTDGLDGYVSLEVSPHLAYDTAGTVANARRLFELVARENLMIKVPATPEGVDAVSMLIASGVNVNVTLIFSLEQYEDAAIAYLEGVEEWIAAGGDPKKPASVASLFVSRVDTAVDERLRDVGDPNLKAKASALLGQAAIANARLAYALYKDIFHGDRFAPLREQGVRPQRPLWASTGTKNPNYPDTYYVDELIGPETVNTMPTATLNAFRDHGEARLTLEQGVDRAQQVFRELEELKIPMDEIMDQLLEDGVTAFADSFDKLLDGVAQKRTRLLRGWGHRSASLGTLQTNVDERLSRLDSEKLAEGIWSGDVTLWPADAKARTEIAQRLGWLQAVETMEGETPRLREFAEEIRSSGFTNAVLLGMGGSSMAPLVFATCFGRADGYLKLDVLDTTVPGAILELERTLDLEKTLFIVASKSGGTIEVVSLFAYFYDRMEKLVGPDAGRRFVAITDPGTSLGKLASEKKFRRTFLNPPDIGGRFSAISYFGLVPAALIGVDLDRLLMRAAQSVEASGPQVPALESPSVWLGAIMGETALAGTDKLTLVLSPGIESFGAWLEQLVAESTGKNGTGILPVDGEPLGRPEVYGQDRLFVYLRLDGEGQHDELISELEKSGRCVVTLRLHAPYDLGREIFRWEFAVAVASSILRVNAFDQPNVQEAKDITKQFLEIYQKEGRFPAGEQFTIDDPELEGALQGLLSAATAGKYLAFNVFLPPTKKNTAILEQVRKVVRDNLLIATTVGFGPRYLHSTGQLHKGGADKGLFVLVTAEDAEDVPIPGQAYSFGALKAAQALGDLEALRKKGRRVVHIHLRSEDELEKLVDKFEGSFSK